MDFDSRMSGTIRVSLSSYWARRRTTRGRASTGTTTAPVASATIQSPGRTVTPPQTTGPFYPVYDQVDKDVDLTRLVGHEDSAAGEVIRVHGQVLDERCKPVAGALVDLWQADANGRDAAPCGGVHGCEEGWCRPGLHGRRRPAPAHCRRPRAQHEPGEEGRNRCRRLAVRIWQPVVHGREARLGAVADDEEDYRQLHGEGVQGPGVGDPYVIPAPAMSYSLSSQRPPGPLRIGFSAEAWSGVPVDPEIRAALLAVARACEAMGHRLEEARPPLDAEAFARANTDLWSANIAHWVADICAATGRPADHTTLEQSTLAVHEHGMSLSAVDLLHADDMFNRVSRDFGLFFVDYDLLLTPTTAQLPWPR